MKLRLFDFLSILFFVILAQTEIESVPVLTPPQTYLVCTDNQWGTYDSVDTTLISIPAPPKKRVFNYGCFWNCHNFVLESLEFDFQSYHNTTNVTVQSSSVHEIYIHTNSTNAITFRDSIVTGDIYIKQSSDLTFYDSSFIDTKIRLEAGIVNLQFFNSNFVGEVQIQDWTGDELDAHMCALENLGQCPSVHGELENIEAHDEVSGGVETGRKCENLADSSLYVQFEGCEIRGRFVLNHISGNLTMHFQSCVFYTDTKPKDNKFIDLSFREGYIHFQETDFITSSQLSTLDDTAYCMIQVRQEACDPKVEVRCKNSPEYMDVTFERINVVLKGAIAFLRFVYPYASLEVRGLSLTMLEGDLGQLNSIAVVYARESLFENVIIPKFDLLQESRHIINICMGECAEIDTAIEIGDEMLVLDDDLPKAFPISRFRNISLYDYNVNREGKFYSIIHCSKNDQEDKRGSLIIEDLYIDSSFRRNHVLYLGIPMTIVSIHGLYGNVGRIHMKLISTVNISDLRPYNLNPKEISDRSGSGILLFGCDNVYLTNIFFEIPDLYVTTLDALVKLDWFTELIVDSIICSDCRNGLAKAVCLEISGNDLQGNGNGSFATIRNSVIENTRSRDGGAIYIRGGKNEIYNSEFINNRGVTTSILTMMGTDAQILFKDCIIQNTADFTIFNQNARSRMTLMSIFEGKLSIYDTIIDTVYSVVIGANLTTDFRNAQISSSQQTVFLMRTGFIDNLTTITCPDDDYPSACLTIESSMFMSTFQFTCSNCPLGYYSLGQPVYSFNVLSNNFCTPCPDVGTSACGGNEIVTLTGYNLIPRKKLILDQCGSSVPVEQTVLEIYRCAPGFCIEGDCTTGRTGSLCTDCIEGYSAQFGSNECIPEDECSFMMLPLIFVFWICFGLFVLKTHSTTRSITSITIKSLVLFFQMLPIYNPENLDGISSVLTSFARGDSTKISSGSNLGFCFFRMKQVDVIIFGGLNVFMCSIAVFIFSFIWPPDNKRFLAIDVFILLIVSVVDIIGTSLLCTQITIGSNKSKLFMVYDTSVECFRWWQSFLIVVYILIILFFCYAIRIVKHTIKDRKSSTFIDLSLYVTYTYRKEVWFWEGALFFFRFMSANISTVAYVDSFWRGTCLTFLAVIFAILSAFFQPYDHSMKILNYFESYLFFLLFLFGVMSISESFHSKKDFPGRDGMIMFQYIVTGLIYFTSVIFLTFVFFCAGQDKKMSMRQRQNELIGKEIGGDKFDAPKILEMTNLRQTQTSKTAVFSLAGGFVSSEKDLSEADDSNVFFM